MAVSLLKAYVTPTQGGNWPRMYTLTPEGHVPEWLMAQRRREMHGVRITKDEANELGFGELNQLALFLSPGTRRAWSRTVNRSY